MELITETSRKLLVKKLKLLVESSDEKNERSGHSSELTTGVHNKTALDKNVRVVERNASNDLYHISEFYGKNAEKNAAGHHNQNIKNGLQPHKPVEKPRVQRQKSPYEFSLERLDRTRK